MQKINYKDFKFDNLLILSTIAKVAYEENPILSDKEELVLHAIKRANPDFSNHSTSEIGEKLSEFDENQLLGFSNNVKGIMHELQFIEIENEDGDNITASIFPDTNHKGFDIMLTDEDTGEIVEVQLKATDSTSYINDWFDEYPEGEIFVTEEIAEKMNLQSSGVSNQKITAETDEYVDKIIDSSETDEFWEYLPYLPTISIAIAGFALFMRYKNSLIDFKTFKRKFIKLTGIKVAKFAVIAGLMAIPVVNVVTGATVLFLTLNSYGKLAKRYGT